MIRLGFFGIVFLIGLALGAIVAALLLARAEHREANRLSAATTCGSSLRIVAYGIGHTVVVERNRTKRVRAFRRGYSHAHADAATHALAALGDNRGKLDHLLLFARVDERGDSILSVRAVRSAQ